MNTTDRLDQIQTHHAVVAHEQEHGEPWGDIYIEQLEMSTQDVPALVNALRAVLDVHREVPPLSNPDPTPICRNCDEDWPCSTAVAIESALGDAQ